MPEIYVECTDEDEDEPQLLRMYRTNVSRGGPLFCLPLCQPDSLWYPDMPELHVEFTDEDEDGSLVAQNVHDEGKRFFILFLCVLIYCYLQIYRNFASSSLTKTNKQV